jgi:hypothetical protein
MRSVRAIMGAREGASESCHPRLRASYYWTAVAVTWLHSRRLIFFLLFVLEVGGDPDLASETDPTAIEDPRPGHQRSELTGVAGGSQRRGAGAHKHPR